MPSDLPVWFGSGPDRTWRRRDRWIWVDAHHDHLLLNFLLGGLMVVAMIAISPASTQSLYGSLFVSSVAISSLPDWLE